MSWKIQGIIKIRIADPRYMVLLENSLDLEADSPVVIPQIRCFIDDPLLHPLVFRLLPLAPHFF